MSELSPPNIQEFRLNLQRLADGELSSQAQRDFLSSIDSQSPESWREVALTLLEQRTWQTQFNSPWIDQSTPSVASVVARQAKPTTHSRRHKLAQRATYILTSCCLGLIVGLLIPVPNQHSSIQHVAMHPPSIETTNDNLNVSSGPTQNQVAANQPLSLEETDALTIKILEGLADQGYRIDTQNYQLTDRWNNEQNIQPQLTSFVAYPSGL